MSLASEPKIYLGTDKMGNFSNVFSGGDEKNPNFYLNKKLLFSPKGPFFFFSFFLRRMRKRPEGPFSMKAEPFYRLSGLAADKN
jgi:hypothetical protein